MDYDAALASLADWAERTDQVRALILTGSAAAGHPHPLSDRDLEIYVDDPDPILADDSWWSSLGDVLVVERLHAPGWHPSRLAYYVGGKLDFTIIPSHAFDTMPRERPFTVLVDKDDRAGSLRITPIAAAHPDAAQFDENLNWAYAAAIMGAKSVVRDEPWSSTIRDGDLKESLLTMIEWDHRARYGLEYDVRFLGSRMRQWMDRDVQDDLESCWGRFDATDSAAALRASIALYARLSARTAVTLGFPPFEHERLRTEIESILGSGGVSSSPTTPGTRAVPLSRSDRAATRPSALLLDFHNTVAVVGSFDSWIADASARVADGSHSREIPTERIRSVWSDARELFPTADWDLDPAAHRHAFISTLTRDAAISTAFADALYETMPHQWVLNDGAADVIARASGAGMPVAIVSNIAIDIRPALERWGILSALDAVILSYEVGFVKPDPRIFQLAADSLGVDPAECLMIGDSTIDDTGGAALGVQSLIARPDQTWRAFALAIPS